MLHLKPVNFYINETCIELAIAMLVLYIYSTLLRKWLMTNSKINCINNKVQTTTKTKLNRHQVALILLFNILLVVSPSCKSNNANLTAQNI